MYEIVVLCVLWALAGLQIQGVLGLPDTFGSIPIGVPFFGALGGVLISLSAVFDFRRKAAWDPSWEAWHYTRWLVGGTVGIVSVLIFQAGVLSTGLSLNPKGGHITFLTYYLIAFAVGYREATFRTLLKRLGDVILAPGAGSAPTVASVHPSEGSLAGGDLVSISGTNLAQVNAVKFGAKDVSEIVGERSETNLLVRTPPGDAGAVPVTVSTPEGSGSASDPFTYRDPAGAA